MNALFSNAYQNLILIRNGVWIRGLEFGFARDSKSFERLSGRVHLGWHPP
jgi:hypothetical protein